MVKEKKTEDLPIEEVKPMTPQELWDAAVAERKAKPQWSCDNNEEPIYNYHIIVRLNEEDKAMDNNIFQLGEPLSVSVALMVKGGSPKNRIVKIPGVEIRFIPPGITPYEKTTDEEGKIKFNPAFLGQWQFIVTDVGIAPKFTVIQ
jgi:hypothetical protein